MSSLAATEAWTVDAARRPLESLADALGRGLVSNPAGVAVSDPDRTVTYAELDALTGELARALVELGVRRGDRVAVWMPKSITAIAVLQAALRIGAAYIPIDPLSPPGRVLQLLRDCAPAALVTRAGWSGQRLGEDEESPARPTLAFDDSGESWRLLGAGAQSEGAPQARGRGGDLAYVLYTSGSTGVPRGVCISHRNALAFVEWAHGELEPHASDRFASHAPLHFDLSVLDLYVAFLAGASVHLIPESAAFVAPALVEFVRDREITVWYSVPSALMLMEGAGLLDAPPSSLRAILFAGEPYPIGALRRLRRAFPHARLLNLYGPTETNVCTSFAVGELDDEAVESLPIGCACCGDRVWAEAGDGREVGVGERGELLVEGPTVMLGYWGREPHHGPYRTGDVVERMEGERYRYVGRRDSMVKLRGYRIELGEVEAALLSHPAVRETAVTVLGEGNTARLVALVVPEPGHAVELLELKRHCSRLLPRHMIIQRAQTAVALPRTANGKVDRRAAARLSAACP